MMFLTNGTRPVAWNVKREREGRREGGKEGGRERGREGRGNRKGQHEGEEGWRKKGGREEREMMNHRRKM